MCMVDYACLGNQVLSLMSTRGPSSLFNVSTTSQNAISQSVCSSHFALYFYGHVLPQNLRFKLKIRRFLRLQYFETLTESFSKQIKMLKLNPHMAFQKLLTFQYTFIIFYLNSTGCLLAFSPSSKRPLPS